MAKTIDERLAQAIDIRDAIMDRMEGRVSENHNSYSIGDRSISKMSLDELTVAYQTQGTIVRQLQKEVNRSNGISSRVRFKF